MYGDELMPKTKRSRWTDYWPFAVVLVYMLIGLISGLSELSSILGDEVDQAAW
jgi:hypothetical protein